MNDYNVYAVNGSTMPAERLREVGWISTGGQTGIIGPSSLLVKAMPTPSSQVRVAPGSFAIQATPSNGVAYASAPGQSYTRRTYGTHTVSIRATGSSGGRTDVVGIVINDPQYDGTTETVDWETHKFFEVIVVENMPGATQPASFSALGKPFLPLARVTIPASTATIQNSMITDLRQVAWKQEDTQTVLLQDPAASLIENGPGWYAGLLVEGPVVPQWATHVKVMGEVTNQYLIGGSIRGRQRMAFWAGGTTQYTAEVPFFFQDPSVRMSIPIQGRLKLKPEHRGQPIDMRVSTRIDTGTGTLRSRTDESWLKLQLVFETAPTDEFNLEDGGW